MKAIDVSNFKLCGNEISFCVCVKNLGVLEKNKF